VLAFVQRETSNITDNPSYIKIWSQVTIISHILVLVSGKRSIANFNNFNILWVYR